MKFGMGMAAAGAGAAIGGMGLGALAHLNDDSVAPHVVGGMGIGGAMGGAVGMGMSNLGQYVPRGVSSGGISSTIKGIASIPGDRAFLGHGISGSFVGAVDKVKSLARGHHDTFGSRLRATGMNMGGSLEYYSRPGRGAIGSIGRGIGKGASWLGGKIPRPTFKGALKTGFKAGKGMAKWGAPIAIGAAVVGAFAFGALETPVKEGAFTKNLDVTSGEGLALAASFLPQPALTAVIARSRYVQGNSDLSGPDYARGLASASAPSGGPMMFSPQGSERGLGKGINVNGNLTLALSNMRRGR